MLLEGITYVYNRLRGSGVLCGDTGDADKEDNSLSTPSSQVSQPQSDSSCSQPVCESRRTRRIRRILKGYHTSGTSPSPERVMLSVPIADIVVQSIRGLRIWEHDIALLLRQLHQLGSLGCIRALEFLHAWLALCSHARMQHSEDK